MKKRIISLLLVAVMIASMIPTAIIPVFAEPSSDRVMKKVDSATLDGKNTNGEYDDANVVYLNHYDAANGDTMRVVYTDEAIYVLVEAIDDTVVQYSDTLDDGTTKAGSGNCDFIFIGFSVGSSYQGVKRAYRTDGRTPLQPADVGVTIDNSYFAQVDNGVNGLSLEARFPISNLSEADQKAYRKGDLEVRFTAGTQDSVNNGTSFGISFDGDIANRDWDGKATEDYFASGSYKIKNPSNYPQYDFEVKNKFMAYAIAAPAMDGKNTDGEYDSADEIAIDTSLTGTVYYGSGSPLPKAVNGDAAPEGSYYKVVYTEDAIYVYANIADTTNVPYSAAWNNSDQTELYFSIGESFKGYQFFFRHTPMTAVNSGSGTANYKVVDNGESGYTIEVQFPVANMTENEQEAYKAGTLDVKFSVRVGDNTGSAITAFYSDNASAAGFRGATDRTNVLSYDYTEFKFLDPADIGDDYENAYVGKATFDGANTNGEYDDADAVVIGTSLVGTVYYGSGSPLSMAVSGTPAPEGSYYKVIYASDAIYVYANIADTTNVPYSAAWNNSDQTELYFKIGESFKGYQFFFRHAPMTAVNSGSGTANYKVVDNGESGYTIEVQFPVANMTENEQEAYKAGTLDVKFSVRVGDNTGSAITAFYSDNENAAGFRGAGDRTNVLSYNYTKFKRSETAEVPEYIPHTTTAPYFDGINTNGEYDNAFVLPLSYSPSYWWGGTPTDDDVAYIMYTDNAIYVYIKGNKGTTNEAYDMTGVAFKIGSSYVGSKIVQNDCFDSTLVSLGEIEMTNDNNYFAYYYNQAEGVLALEAKFPVANMTEEDKEAFANGTLRIELGAISMNDYITVSSFPIESYNAFLNQENVETYVLPYLTLFGLGERTTEGEINYLPHAPNGIKMDGKITEGEYDDAFVLPLSHSGASWWGRTPTDNDVAYVTYTQDAIYIFIKGNNGLTDDAYDMTGVAFKIGSSYVGTKIVQNHFFNSTLISLGEVEVTNDNNFFRYYYSQEKGILDLEVMFPIDKMTAEDQEAFKNGTLSIELGAMNMDNYTTVASFPIGSYSAFLSQSGAEEHVLPYLTSFTLKPYVFSGNEDPEPVEIKEKINLKHNVFCFLPSYDGVRMKYTIGDNAPVYVEGVLVDEFAKEYSFSYEVSYKYMNEKVTVELVDREGALLEVVDTYIMVEYCQKLLEQTAEELGISANEYEFMKIMVDATLALGDAAENAEGQDPTLGAVIDPIVESTKETYGVEILENGVYFDGEQINKMYVKFKADDISKLTVGFATASLRYVATLEILPVDGEEDTYIVITPAIDATNFDDNYIISFVHTEDVYTRNTVHKITCNVNAGLAALAESADAVIADLAIATYNYGVAVRYYKAS